MDTTSTTIDTESSSDTSVSTGNDVSQTSAASPEPTQTTDATPAKKPLREVMSEALDKIKADKDAPAEPVGGKRTLPTGGKPVVQAPAQAASEGNAEDFDPISGKPYEPIKAPASMPPALRETWSKLPREHQQFWSKREQDMAQNYTRLGQSDKSWKAIQESAKDIIPLLKANNTTLEAFSGRVFNEVHQLVQGSPQQKAVLLANMIKQYKPDAAALKAALSGQQVNVPQQRKPVNIEAEVQKRIQAEKNKEREGSFAKDIEDFNNDPAHEFARDVEGAMSAAIQGGLIEVDGKTSKEILKAAYDFAVSNHPQIKGILAARGTAPTQQAPAQQSTPTSGPRAVRSAKASPGAGAVSGTPKKTFKTTRDAAAAAYDQIFSGK